MPNDYTAYGGAAELFRSRDREVLLDGPAGTGKSRACGEYINWFCDNHPGCRVLVFRKTRVSLTESWLVTFEEKILWPDHPVIQNGPTREHRSHYDYPNGSRIVLGGMDNPTRLFSTEYDLAYCNEATEVTQEEWESIHRALRNNVAPYQQLLGDCNPDSEFHWLNQRCFIRTCEDCGHRADLESSCSECGGKTVPLTRRIHSRFEDNPSLTDEYLARLRANLSGVRLQRLYYGKWVSAEGLIFEEYDPAKHLLASEHTFEDNGGWGRHYLDIEGQDRVELKWFIAGIDFGFSAPGCLQVWGVDGDSRLYRVAEVYRRKEDLDWWAERAAELYKRFPFRRIVCDSAEPRSIQYLNDRIGPLCDRELPRIAIGCEKGKNAKTAGFNQIRSLLKGDARGPQLMLCRDALYTGRDKELLKKGKPTCAEEEILAYVHLDPILTGGKERNNRQLEDSDPACADHAMDAMRYVVDYVWKKNMAKAEPAEGIKPGTFADLLGTPQTLARESLRERKQTFAKPAILRRSRSRPIPRKRRV